jgi:polyphosphate kinase
LLNRELSWLEFNRRVLDEACDPSVPLAERLKFQGIVSSNLDEFFMVRVAGLKHLVSSGVTEARADGLSPREQLLAIRERVHEMVDRQYRNWREDLEPGLAQKAGIVILRPHHLSAEQKAVLQHQFAKRVWPVLTPLAVDQGHPFPVLRNRSLNLAVLLHKQEQRVARRKRIFAVVQVPSVLNRLVEVPATPPHKAAFLLLEDWIAMQAGDLFPGFRVVACSPFRLTRDFDLSIDEDEADDLLKTIQRELRRRERGKGVRLEVAHDTPMELLAFLRGALRLESEDVYPVNGLLHLTDLSPLYSREELNELKDAPMVPQESAALHGQDLFQVIAAHDILLHHPYESFDPVVDFVAEAAEDPQVLAIKQTLYRTGADSPIVRALARAAENGKQVTALIELKARFDEGRNIAWARVLEDAGVHVVYGVVGLKTHCKVSLVVRREGDLIRRYVHLSTGNYNPITARQYVDLSYFTARDTFANDAGNLFNLLTGYSAPPSWQRFAVAPICLTERLLELIERERSHGAHGRIIAKMNSLSDPQIIQALYRAAQEGVSIDLLVRGVCCLRPGVPGLSDSIRVTSVVDRFLEHTRIFCFGSGARREVYLASADWMSRNLTRRVEVMFPVDDPELRTRLIDEILSLSMADNMKASRLLSDGSYQRVRPEPNQETVRSQERFVALASKAQRRIAVEERESPVLAGAQRSLAS